MMNTMMNGMQLCAAAEARCDVHAGKRQPAALRPTLPRFDARRLNLGIAAVLAGTLVAGLAAAALTVARTGVVEPLSAVELPRVAIEAKQLPPAACPVPVAAAAACPVPIDAHPVADMNTTSRRTPL